MTTKRIAIWGASSLNNWGDRLIALITEKELRARIPESFLAQLCPWNSHDDRRLWFDKNGKWPYAADFDAVVVAGGGLFAGPPFKHPVMQLFCFGAQPDQFAPKLCACWNAVGQQDDACAGNNPHWAKYTELLRSRLDYCSVRSKTTAEHIGQGSELSPTHVVPDSVYALPPLRLRNRIRGKRIRVGVALGSPFPTREFVSTLAGSRVADSCPFEPSICLTPAEFMSQELPPTEIARQQTLLPLAVSALNRLSRVAAIEFFGFGLMYGDAGLATTLSGLVTGSTCRTGADDFDDLQTLFASYDVLIVSRYHAAILAHRAGRPFIGVDPHWSHRTQTSKLHELMRSINQSQFYWNGAGGEEAASAGLWERFETWMELEASREAVPYEEMHRQSLRNFDRLSSAIMKGR